MSSDGHEVEVGSAFKLVNIRLYDLFFSNVDNETYLVRMICCLVLLFIPLFQQDSREIPKLFTLQIWGEIPSKHVFGRCSILQAEVALGGSCLPVWPSTGSRGRASVCPGGTSLKVCQEQISPAACAIGFPLACVFTFL